MPPVSGQFVPRPWVPLVAPHTLFDVLPPGHPDEEAPATAADREWYRRLRMVTARAVWHIVAEVDRNYTGYRGTAFSGTALGRLQGYRDVIALDILDGEMTPSQVNNELTRAVKTFGLTVHDQQPGTRHNWPMAPRLVSLDEALEYVERMFWGRWPASGGHDPMALLADVGR
jgi:hypothetical protein